MSFPHQISQRVYPEQHPLESEREKGPCYVIASQPAPQNRRSSSLETVNVILLWKRGLHYYELI